MKYRIAMWASAGFIVADCWGLYFGITNRALPIGQIVYTLARLTQPVVAVTVSYFNFPVGLRAVMAWNAATYALIGLIVETIRKQLPPVSTLQARSRIG